MNLRSRSFPTRTWTIVQHGAMSAISEIDVVDCSSAAMGILRQGDLLGHEEDPSDIVDTRRTSTLSSSRRQART